MSQTRRGDTESQRPRFTRAEVVAFSVASWLAIFGIIPWAIGRRGRRVGWSTGRPAPLNRLGLVPLGLGAAGLTWCLAAHYAPGETVALSLIPENLISSGPYRFSRNPMYVSEEATLVGWTLYFGSPGLLGCTVALATAMRYAVSREERTLLAWFGESWQEFAATVPRWL
jgi:protein-S-isoprenylcysteine O-methyltransferase Ste14